MRKRLRKKKDKREVIKMVNEDSHIPYLIDLMVEGNPTTTIIIKGCSIPHTCIGTYEDSTSFAIKDRLMMMKGIHRIDIMNTVSVDSTVA
jgi:hypothetical protein